VRPVLIDCDPGMDDAIALLLALGDRRLDVVAVTAATGNLTAERTSVNARKILDLAGAGAIPVAQGPNQPLVQPYPADPFSHGGDGLGETDLPDSPRPLDPRPAPQLIVDMVHAYTGRLTIIATAPLTNLALAFQESPDIADQIERVVLIGGAFGFNESAWQYATGDNPVSEWNFRVDPDAAHIVLRSGVPITALGVDVWGGPQLNLDPRHRERLQRSATPAARFLCSLLDYVERRGYGSYTVLIDALAVAAVLAPSLIETCRVRVDVETKGELTLGQTVVERRLRHGWTDLPEIEAACDVDAGRFHELLIRAIVGERGPNAETAAAPFQP
jgi:inosine-uridine nucleoside N-ribohydrolase